jgi:hypothetical protein
VSRSRVSASYEASLDLPAAAVWRYFDWPNLALMLPGGFFADVVYDDQRAVAGASRTIVLGAGNGDGTPLREVLESCDGDAMQLRYRILDPAPMPIERYRGAVRVLPTGDASCAVQFSSDCTLNGIDAATWRETYRAMQQANLEFIARSLGTR